MITDLISIGLKLLDKVIPDAKQAAEAKQKLFELQQSGELSEIESQSKIITAEAQSESWLARSWRPITMLTFVAIIANNYIFAPYLMAFGFKGIMLQLPPDMWILMQIGLGGYIFGRSIENGISKWKK